MIRKAIHLLVAITLIGGMVVGGIACGAESRLRVGTTTSLYDTGLWTELEPLFEQKYNVVLDVIAAGSGAVMNYGRNGDVDVVTVHSKADELQFIADGHGIERIPFAYNYFVIVGPPEDPAGLNGLSPEEAFRKLYDNPGLGHFVSRGDNSGTHAKEKAIWESAGFADYNALKAEGIAEGWYIEAGKSMGETLNMASEKQAYTLSDEGTYLAYKSKLDLVPIVERGSILLNVYSVIVCTKSTKQALGQKLIEFLSSTEIQELIGDYGKSTYGKGLFVPCAGQEEPTS